MKRFFFIMLFAYCMQQVFAQADQTLSNLTSPTSVNVALLPKNDNKLNLGSANKSWKNIYIDSSLYLGGNRFLACTAGTDNTAVGSWALFSNISGYSNVAIGVGTLYKNTAGHNLVAIGDSALYNQSVTPDGYYYNTAIGSKALFSNIRAIFNTAIGFDALYSNTTGNSNTANGNNSLYNNINGSNNTANGDNALYNNTSGSYNTADGATALRNNETGDENTANGFRALYSNTSGGNNTANGSVSLYANTKGGNNTAIGYAALYTNIEGNNNSAVGEGSLSNNLNGNSNTANGYYALANNATGNSNTAFGNNALFSVSDLLYSLNAGSSHCTAVGSEAGWQNSKGGNNTYFGYHTGSVITTQSNNTLIGAFTGNENAVSNATLIGYDADPNGTYSNITALGYQAKNTNSNQVRIGNSAVTSIGGYANWSNVSDGRIKKNIKQNVPGLAFINKLSPVTYNLNLDAANKIVQENRGKNNEQKLMQAPEEDLSAQKEKEQVIYSGFVAQDVERAAKQIGYDFSGVDAPKNDKDLYGLRYSDFVVPLVKAVQQLSKMNDDKDAKIDKLQKQNDDLEKRLEKLEALMNVNLSTASVSNASLEQNIPNPFNHTTTIGYLLSNNFSSAQILITDKSGKQLKQVNISNAGKGVITLDASTLSSGAYYYSLYADGKLIASKQMELIK